MNINQKKTSFVGSNLKVLEILFIFVKLAPTDFQSSFMGLCRANNWASWKEVSEYVDSIARKI